MQFLICIDGSAEAEAAAPIGLQLAQAAGARAVVLGVWSTPEAEAGVRAAAARLPAEARLRPGRPAVEYLREAETGGYDLVVIGSRGRRDWLRLAFGSTAARMARFSRVPVLIIKGPPRPALRRVLACTGGEAPGERVARWAGQLGRWLGAEVTILHVMSQIAVGPQANLEDLEETAEQALTRRTREGLHLERELELLRGPAGEAPPASHPKIRHGAVVQEVLTEVREGDYDLVVIGGHQAPEFTGRSHIKAYLIEDIADHILTELDRPVLVVK